MSEKAGRRRAGAVASTAPPKLDDRTPSRGNHPRRLALRGSEVQVAQPLAIAQHDLASAGKSKHLFIVKLRQRA